MWHIMIEFEVLIEPSCCDQDRNFLRSDTDIVNLHIYIKKTRCIRKQWHIMIEFEFLVEPSCCYQELEFFRLL